MGRYQSRAMRLASPVSQVYVPLIVHQICAEGPRLITARRKAYNGIRRSIIFGKFQPGEQLKEEELAAKFKVSRTPVRQAIRQLADEGLVFIGSNKRSYVTDISEAQAEEAFDMLAFLESYAAKLAAQRITDEELEQLQALHQQLGDLAKSNSADDHPYLELNSKFHSLIHEAADNRILSGLLRRVSDLPYAMYLKFKQKTEDSEAVAEHERLLKALCEHDAVAAELHMRLHIEGLRSKYRDICKEAAQNSQQEAE